MSQLGELSALLRSRIIYLFTCLLIYLLNWLAFMNLATVQVVLLLFIWPSGFFSAINPCCVVYNIPASYVEVQVEISAWRLAVLTEDSSRLMACNSLHRAMMTSQFIIHYYLGIRWHLICAVDSICKVELFVLLTFLLHDVIPGILLHILSRCLFHCLI